MLEGEGNTNWFLGDRVKMTRRHHLGYLMDEATAVGCLRAEATTTNACEANGEMRRWQRVFGGRSERWAGRQRVGVRERNLRETKREIYQKRTFSLHRWCGLTYDGPICGSIIGVLCRVHI